jgi:hypothetical protein
VTTRLLRLCSQVAFIILVDHLGELLQPSSTGVLYRTA